MADNGVPYVSASDAARVPYPYVYVNADGTVRELHTEEREYLETPFEGGDGGRPYVKANFDSKDGWGEIKGFCRRSSIPAHLPIAEAPKENPNKPVTIEDMIEMCNRYKQSKVPSQRPWWKFWA